MVSMEAELKKREKAIRMLRQRLKSSQIRSNRSSKKTTDVSEAATVLEIEKKMLLKEKYDLKRVTATQENIINTQNSRILALTDALNSYSNTSLPFSNRLHSAPIDCSERTAAVSISPLPR